MATTSKKARGRGNKKEIDNFIRAMEHVTQELAKVYGVSAEPTKHAIELKAEPGVEPELAIQWIPGEEYPAVSWKQVRVRSAVGYRDANIVYIVRIENSTDSAIYDIHIKPKLSTDALQLDNDELVVETIHARKATNVTFILKPIKAADQYFSIGGEVTYRERKYAAQTPIRHQLEMITIKLPPGMAVPLSPPEPPPKLPETVPAPTAEGISVREEALSAGFTYLVECEKPSYAYKLFTQAVSQQASSLCITRNYPDKVRDHYQITPTKIIWLTNVSSPEALRPSDLEKLRYAAEKFVNDNRNVAVILDGIEYLIVHNKYSSVLKFIQSLRDQIAITKSILILPISPSTVNQTELKLLEREVDKIIHSK